MDGKMGQQHMFRREILGKSVSTICGFFLIILTVAISARQRHAYIHRFSPQHRGVPLLLRLEAI